MDKPISISVGEVSKAAKVTVEKVLARHKAAFPTIPEHRIGFFPPHYWFGFVIFNPQVEKVPFGELVNVAVEVKRGIADSVNSAGAGRPGVMLNDGILTIGFAPPIDANLFEG